MRDVDRLEYRAEEYTADR